MRTHGDAAETAEGQQLDGNEAPTCDLLSFKRTRGVMSRGSSLGNLDEFAVPLRDGPGRFLMAGRLRRLPMEIDSTPVRGRLPPPWV